MGNYLYQKQLVIAITHICRRMAGELWFAAALGCQKTERDQFPLRIIQARPGVIIPEAVVSQPQVDMPAFLRTRKV